MLSVLQPPSPPRRHVQEIPGVRWWHSQACLPCTLGSENCFYNASCVLVMLRCANGGSVLLSLPPLRRYVQEIPGVKKVVANDLDAAAVEAARRNAEVCVLTSRRHATVLLNCILVWRQRLSHTLLLQQIVCYMQL